MIGNPSDHKLRYIIAALLMFCLISINQVIIQYFLDAKKYDEKLVNDAGRQRMLSQKVNLRIYEYLNNHNNYNSVNETFLEWKNGHIKVTQLLEQSRYNNLSTSVDILDSLFLHVQILEKQLANLDATSGLGIRLINSNQEVYLIQMDLFVQNLEIQGRKSLQALKLIELLLGVISCFVLILEFRLIILPVHKKLNQIIHEKNLLFKDYNHRVKNNFQFISSLFYLGIRKTQTSSENVFNEAIGQIQSIGQLHEFLLRQPHDKIFFESYITVLTNKLADIYHISFDLSIKGFDIELSHSSAQNIGLIINELATNTVKYNTNQELLTIQVLVNITRKKVMLCYIEPPAEKPVETKYDYASSGFGSSLIEQFSKELNAEFKVEKNNGYIYSFTIPTFTLLQ